MKPTVTFSGTIRAITPDGANGVVILTNDVCGKTYAVISPETRGRVALMNGIGRLQEGAHVRGVAEEGSEALRAITIEADK